MHRRVGTLSVRPAVQRTPKLIVGAAVGLGIVAFVGLKYFAPKGSTTVDQAAPTDVGAVVASGTFRGADATHDAAGSVSILRGDGETHLRFEGYDATAGPDVYLYVSPNRDGAFDDRATKILVPGGAEDGQATLRGNFNVPLPAEIDPEQIGSVIVWCKRFGVTFGLAELR